MIHVSDVSVMLMFYAKEGISIAQLYFCTATYIHFLYIAFFFYTLTKHPFAQSIFAQYTAPSQYIIQELCAAFDILVFLSCGLFVL